MSTKAQVNAKFTMDTSQAQKSMGKVESDFGNMQNKMSRQLGTMAVKWGAIAATGIATSIASAIASSINQGIQQGLAGKKTLDDARNLLGGTMGDEGKATELEARIDQMVIKYPFLKKTDLMEAASTMSTNTKGDVNETMKSLQTANLLMMKDPAQGLKGAQIALAEANSGDYRSLRMRYEFADSDIKALQKKGLKGADLVQELLKSKGITEELLQKRGDTIGAQMEAIENLRESGNIEAVEKAAAAIKESNDQVIRAIEAGKQGKADIMVPAIKAKASVAGHWEKLKADALMGYSALNSYTTALIAGQESGGLLGRNNRHFANDYMRDKLDYSQLVYGGMAPEQARKVADERNKEREAYKAKLDAEDSARQKRQMELRWQRDGSNSVRQQQQSVRQQQQTVTVNINSNGVHGMTASQGGVS